MISPMPVSAARLAFLFHVSDFTARCHLAVLADHAPAGESSEAEKPNETHHVFLSIRLSKFCALVFFRAFLPITTHIGTRTAESRHPATIYWITDGSLDARRGRRASETSFERQPATTIFNAR